MEQSAQPQAEPILRPPARILVLATDELAGPELIEEFRRRLSNVEAEVMVIAPAVEKTVFHHALGDVDTAVMEAGRRLETSLDELRRAGVPALGEVGDSDPIVAAEDALRLFVADEVLIVAHADDQARWFEDGLFERAKQELRPAVRLLTVWHEDGEPPHLAGIEESGPGRSAEREQGHSPNLPRFTRNILVAIITAVVAIVLIATIGITLLH
ncbi:MAG TPA: hypothetical protein VIY71_07370 [Solirubrobacterales bacterium]